MKKTLVGISAVALVATLSACGGADAPANNIAMENDMNAMMTAEAIEPAEPVANASDEPPAPEAAEPAASKPTAPAKPATPSPAKPEPEPDPHAGHDMNNMSN